ncbi:SRPBCC domain-containing protein [Arthrobacter sp. SDTb3-6]|uniref:SRPBCC domain-containing protein n=1 Tax=Arthrobacter sp. SDTb3-6 TaxID=2713571 RepID=UPI00159DA9E3|nr:SRPBCC domain-containing protein [Arthrobacter sp. SDTb3-6]NVM99397.1 polyketide cyclase [Arthrobacter sp. SDTb3-6]
MADIMDMLTGITRLVKTTTLNHQEATSVVLQLEVPAPVHDVWAACTEADSIQKWFLPISGDLGIGGRYALEGNASGEVLDCNAGRSFRVSWVMGQGPDSELLFTVTPTNVDHSLVELAHTSTVDPEMMANYGPGSVGVGWDGALLGLQHYLRGIPTGPQHRPAPEIMNPFMAASSEAWADAAIANGANPGDARAAARRTTAFYTGTDGQGAS